MYGFLILPVITLLELVQALKDFFNLKICKALGVYKGMKLNNHKWIECICAREMNEKEMNEMKLNNFVWMFSNKRMQINGMYVILFKSNINGNEWHHFMTILL